MLPDRFEIVSYFFLAERSATLDAASSGGANSPTLGRPFFNILTNREDAELLALPGQQAAGIQVNATTRLQGAEATGLVGLCGGEHYRLEMLIGFRFLSLDDKLGITQQEVFLPAAPLNAGSVIRRGDEFDVANRYYAGQVGIRAESCYRGLLLGATGKLALGATEETSAIAGATSVTPPLGNPVVRGGGLLAQPTNSGRFTHSRFAVVPEVGVHLGYQWGPHLRFLAGYNFLYWSDVVRAGDQVDRAVGPARPAFSFRSTDFWAQGGSFGLEVRY